MSSSNSCNNSPVGLPLCSILLVAIAHESVYAGTTIPQRTLVSVRCSSWKGEELKKGLVHCCAVE